jgi:hypothetical protein
MSSASITKLTAFGIGIDLYELLGACGEFLVGKVDLSTFYTQLKRMNEASGISLMRPKAGV